jgi:peptide deformylase
MLDPDSLQIVWYPDPILRQPAKPVDRIDDQVRRVAGRMLSLMHQAPGVGLAAPQVGVSWRLFVANPTGEPADDLVFVNPVLTNPSSATEDHEEGCLSLPHINAIIRRPRAITITAMDLNGRTFSLAAEGLPARIWQHEYDHLDGILILDRMLKIDKLANREALRQLEAGLVPDSEQA